jgi:RNA recognition motif-containing protein
VIEDKVSINEPFMLIQITNLNLSLVEADLRRLFTPFGEIGSVQIIRDPRNNRSSGRALVDMPVEKEGRQVLASLQGKVLAGKAITLMEMPASR